MKSICDVTELSVYFLSLFVYFLSSLPFSLWPAAYLMKHDEKTYKQLCTQQKN